MKFVKLLRPASAVMDRLRISHKFGLIFFIVLVPMLILSFVIVQEKNFRIRFVESEIEGLRYIQLIRGPIEYIQQHRGLMAAKLSGEEGLDTRIKDVQAKVDRNMEQLQKGGKRLGESMETASEMEALQGLWQQIKSDLRMFTKAKSFQRHTQLVDRLIRLASHVADTSNITLDPELDSYYLGDAVVNRLLDLIEIMGQSRAVGSSAAAAGKLDRQTHLRLALLVENMDRQNQNLEKGVQAAFKENPGIEASLGRFFEKSARAVSKLQGILSKDLLQAENISIHATAVFDAATDAISESYRLYDSIVPELHGLFTERLDDALWMRNLVLVLVCITLALVIYLFAGFYVSVSRSIISISEMADKLGSGDTTARIEVNQGHEIGGLQSSMQDMATQLHGVISDVANGVETLASSSTELTTIS